jgi:hypothetical protein
MKPVRNLSGKRLTDGRVRAPHLQAVRIRRELEPRPLTNRSCVYRLMSIFFHLAESDWNKKWTKYLESGK